MQQLSRVLRTEINLRPLKAIFIGLFGFLGRLPFALAAGVAANDYAYRGSLFLLSVPKGATIRPMFQAALEMAVVMGALIIGVPLAAGEMYRSVRRQWPLGFALGLIGLLLCLSPWSVGDYFWDDYSASRGIHFEP